MANEIGIRNGIRTAFRNSDGPSGAGNTGGGNSIFFARVSFVLLDDSNKEKFDKYGGWKALGTIECTPFVNNHSVTDVIEAIPVTSNLNIYPLVNEIVLVTLSVSSYAQGDDMAYVPKYYYTQVLSAWNTPEHNAVPNSNWADNGANLVTGLFNQNGKVPKIIKAPGDITLEGRSGNLVRMGSSIKDFKGPFNGPDRSPVVTIVNKYRELPDYKIGSYEDINLDGSSLYMLNGHNVNFIASSINFDSYNIDITQDVSPEQPSPKTAYVQAIMEKKEPEKAVPPVVDTPPVAKPVVNTANISSPNNQSLIAGDDSELEDRPYEETPFTQFDIENGIELKDCAPAAPKIETGLPAKEGAVDAATIYKNAVATRNIRWEAQQEGDWCFIASTTIVLKSYNLNVNQTIISKYRSGSLLLPTKVAEVYKLGYDRVFLPNYNKSGSYQQILRTIRNNGGKPFILQRKGNFFANHFVVVIGATPPPDDRVVVIDPGKREYSNGIFLSMENLKEVGGSLVFYKN